MNKRELIDALHPYPDDIEVVIQSEPGEYEPVPIYGVSPRPAQIPLIRRDGRREVLAEWKLAPHAVIYSA